MGFILLLVVVIFCIAYVARWLLAIIAAVMLLGFFTDQKSVHVDAAADYRAAQHAVEQATGKPCDYRCKEAIADLAREDLRRAPPEPPSGSASL